MKISVAYNGDLEFIDKVKEYKSVATIFGAPGEIITGGGRSSFLIPAITDDDIAAAVLKAHSYGIQFNYLLNSSCMGNKEYRQSTYHEIVNHLDRLAENKVDWVTIANPYLIRICKKRHPRIKISVSSFAMVESVQRAKYFDSMGVDEITVRENINRDFNLLKELKKQCRCEIQVLANQTCLFQCPYQFYHDNVSSHASQIGDSTAKGFLDFCILSCTRQRYGDPAEFIKSRWIRPDDIAEYEKIGITQFKLADRSKSTRWLLNTVGAYNRKEFKGNLADILNIFRTTNRRHRPGTSAGSNLTGSPEVTHMRKLARAFMLLDVQIENKYLHGFLEHFKRINCRAVSCDDCLYCKQVADKAVVFPDKKNLSYASGIIGELLNKMITRTWPGCTREGEQA
jgi:collagenase-like PrtC family protease